MCANASGASEVCNFDDKPFGDQDILRFQISVKDAFYVHGDEGLDNLLENLQNLTNGEIFLLFFVVVKQVSFLTILHQNFNHFVFFLHLIIIDLDKIMMRKFFHDIDFLFRLFDVKGINSDFFQGVSFAFIIFDEVYVSKTAFPEWADNFIVFLARNCAHCRKTATYHL